ncbi:MAG: HlyD family efflux transporter periplasmic adaptor subunit [Muribaculaceae bacterium]|jgi:HlyD family secretion protein|nr:HlyD family efflux transporter periplasmic adaptor subunit [Muribaculaceae bacterium]
MKRITIMAGVLLLLVACGNKEKEYDATGTFEATEVTVSAKSTGELQRFDVTEGQEIDQNVVVGTIDAYQLKLQRQQLENTKEQLKANKKQLNATRGATNSKQLDLEKQVASIRQQIANAQRERQRYNELVNDGAVPRKQLDDINYQIKVLEKQLAATQEQIRSNNASLKEQSQGITAQMEGIDAQQLTVESQKAQLDDQIANSDIKAPITGSVLEKYVERGEYVTVGKPLFKMADTQNMFIRAYVTSAQLKDIKVGQQVKVFADYGNGQKKSYDGTVTWISSRSEFTPKTILTDDERADLVYAVKIAFKNDGYVKIGMYGEVKFQK